MSVEHQQNSALPLSELRTIEDLAAENPKILSVPVLRWQMRHRDTNGLAACCVRVGRRVLIHLPGYERWLGSNREVAL